MHTPLNTTESGRLINSLAGGWVADAASLGLHWLYSSERIAEIAGNTPEFLPPRAEYYTKGFGYFAHEGKQVGDVSHYGAATGVLTQSLLANNGALDIRDYQRRFRSFFGPGGHWRGFIDNPTRITIENFNAIERDAIEQAQSCMPDGLTDKQKRILVQKVMPYTRRLSGDRLARPVREAINLTYQDREIQEAGVLLAQTIDRHLVRTSGADDLQLPAVSKLAPLVATHYGRDNLREVTEAAVRVTNNNEEAVTWAKCTAVLLDQLFRGAELSEAMGVAISEAPDPSSLRGALKGSELDGVGAGDTFGRTCYLNEAMPVIFHILGHANSYTDAIRANIYCGGDSCGRAWIIGPAMAAIHGVGGKTGMPLSWLARVTDAATVYRDIESLVQGAQAASESD